MTDDRQLERRAHNPPTQESQERPIPSVTGIRELVRNVALLEIQQLRSKVEVEVENHMFGRRLERDFAKRVSEGEVSMADILARPSTDVEAMEENWEGVGDQMAVGMEVVNSIVPEKWREVLQLKPAQLAKLHELQVEERERIHGNERETASILESYSRGLRNLNVPEHPPFVSLKWGALQGIWLQEGSNRKIFHLGGHLEGPEINGDKWVYFGVSTATSIPGLLYQATFEAEKGGRLRGLVDQKLVSRGTVDIAIVDGWDEWFGNIKGSL